MATSYDRFLFRCGEMFTQIYGLLFHTLTDRQFLKGSRGKSNYGSFKTSREGRIDIKI